MRRARQRPRRHLAGCVSSSGLSGDVYSASEAKQVQSVTYGTIVHTLTTRVFLAWSPAAMY
ncbi:hypothetical protein FK513_28900 [Klebsiella pneumoniae]|nr:hypothetical protein [Klebsiella pneumoniae]